MDDNTFDDLIRKKLEGYEGPPFDQSSFDALPDTPVASSVSAPWFANTATRFFVVSSMLLFTLVNSAILYSVFSKNSTEKVFGNDQPATGTVSQISLAYASELDSLKSIIEKMKCDLQNAQDVTSYNAAKDEPRQFSTALSVPSNATDERVVTVGQEAGAEPGHHLTAANSTEFNGTAELWHERSPLVIERIRLGPLRFVDAKSHPVDARANELKNNRGIVSLATQKAMEKHYFKMGLELAPHLDVVQGIFKHGDSGLQPRIGIAADLIMTPNWSVETGVDYMTISSRFNPGDISVPNVPGGSEYGSVHSIGTKYTVLSAPVTLKYRQWITPSNQLFVKAGWKPYASASLDLQYDYQSNASSADDTHVAVTTLEHRDGFSYFGSTVSAAIGLTGKMKNPKNKIEVSLFYEKSLGTVSQQNLNMQLAGVRAAYWFKLK